MASKTRSEIWKHFEMLTDSEQQYMQCRTCAAKYKHVDGSTTGAREHLRLKHPDLMESLRNAERMKPSTNERKLSAINLPGSEQQSIMGWFSKSSKASAESITEKILLMLLHQNLPWRFVDQPAFKELMKLVAPGYDIPGRKVFATTILNESMQQQVSEIRNAIKVGAPPGIALTSDIWKSRAGDSYIDLHGFFIARDFR